ncbi:MAG: PEP-CTERM sorting domain-containing protein [Pirellulaceae bacterium]
MKRFLIASVLSLVCLANVSLRAELITVAWEINGVSGFGPSPFGQSGTTNPTVTANLVRGSGVTTTGTAATNAWGGNGFDASNLTNAISGGDFITISITNLGPDLLSLTSFTPFNVRRSGTGPTSGQFQFQKPDNTWVNVGSQLSYPSNSSGGNNFGSIDLAAVAGTQELVAGTYNFRLVNWGGTSSSGTWYFNNFQSGPDFSFTGTLTAVPEPTALLLAGVGLAIVGCRRKRR